MIAVGAAERLGDDVVDDAQFGQMSGGQPQGVGGLGASDLVGLLPENAGHPSGLMTE